MNISLNRYKNQFVMSKIDSIKNCFLESGWSVATPAMKERFRTNDELILMISKHEHPKRYVHYVKVIIKWNRIVIVKLFSDDKKLEYKIKEQLNQEQLNQALNGLIQ